MILTSKRTAKLELGCMGAGSSQHPFCCQGRAEERKLVHCCSQHLDADGGEECGLHSVHHVCAWREQAEKHPFRSICKDGLTTYEVLQCLVGGNPRVGGACHTESAHQVVACVHCGDFKTVVE